ncbi:MAG: HK97 gp10 family phage protein [Acidobacteria bacterium]|nr:HK97 gp10 family phage protein [Acidobacteriota bacterium]
MSIKVSKLTFLADVADDIAAEALMATAEFILTLIRLYAPVKTGALRSSYEIQEESPLSLIIGTWILYAKYQEIGFHHYQSGKFIQNPHIVPAFFQGESFFARAVERAIASKVG